MDVKSIILQANKEKRGLLESEAMDILKKYNIQAPEYKIAKTEKEAVIKAKEIGYPVVMKVVSQDILHKTDYGCVKLNLNSDEEVKKAYNEILFNARNDNENVRINGIIIYPFVPKGIEVIIGVTEDEQFGKAIMFGLGGIFVEILKDVSFRIIPLSKKDAIEMIKETKGYNILKGTRGEKEKDMDSIIDTILKISKLVTDFPEIKEIDLNPLYVYENGIKVLDARILV